MKEIHFFHQIEAAIAGNPILRLLPERGRGRFAEEARLFRFAKKEALYRAGDSADSGWTILSGQVRIVKGNHEQHRLIIEVIVAGEICGAFCGSRRRRFVFSGYALEETVALRFPIKRLEEAAKADLRVASALREDSCRRLFHAQHMRSLLGEDVANRVACALVYLQSKFGNEIPHTRLTLAQLAGTSVESAIRATRQLVQKGVVETDRHRIRIIAPRALKDFAHPPS